MKNIKKVYPMKFMPFNRAFTLIELLVVVAIVGILSGFIFVSMNDTIDMSKDAKRKVDTATIEKVILMYSIRNNGLPGSSDVPPNTTYACTIGGGDNPCTTLEEDIQIYLPNPPVDPDGNYYVYTYSNIDGESFTLEAVLSDNSVYQYDSITNTWATLYGTQATPTFGPSAGIIMLSTTVTITSAGADAIYYTLDGSDPTTSSINQAVTPLVINSAGTVKALAVKSGYANSSIATAVYTTCGETVNFTYRSGSVTYGTVISPAGKCWMDRNLGASQVAIAYDDTAAYGDLFQWGRLDDDHQLRTSGTTSTLSSTDDPGHSNFIINGAGFYDWRSPQNSNLWQGDGGTNTPCPSGWRLPTISEWNAEISAGDWDGRDAVYASSLKMPAGGYRQHNNAILALVGTSSCYWSSSTSNPGSYSISFGLIGYNPGVDVRARGYSVRCIRN